MIKWFKSVWYGALCGGYEGVSPNNVASCVDHSVSVC